MEFPHVCTSFQSFVSSGSFNISFSIMRCWQIIMIIDKTSQIFFIILISFCIVCCLKLDECRRNCEEKSTAKECIYEFFVSPMNHMNDSCISGNCRQKWLGINGKSPGPSIEVCLGDTLEVIVHNKLKSDELSFHWHGIRQKGFAHMDGVPMITQCPILPFGSFRYRIKLEHSGTFYYHAHSVLQQANGLFGSLIVRGLKESLALEKTLMVSSRSSSPLSLIAQAELPTPVTLSLNGKETNIDFKVLRDQDYLLRVINSNVFNCPVTIYIEQHTLEIAAVDGSPINPRKNAGRVIVFPGERIDFILTTNMPPRTYQILIQGFLKCRNLIHGATLIYDDVEFEAVKRGNSSFHLEIPETIKGHGCNELENNLVCSLDTKNLQNEQKSDEIYATYHISFDVNSYEQIDDNMTDYSFSIYDYTYYPAYLTTDNGETKIRQVNQVTFKYPPSPILSQPEAIPDDLLCSPGHRSKSCDNNPLFCECLQLFEIPPNRTIEFILIDEGFGSDTSQVFHSHGYSVSIVGAESFGEPVSKQDIIALDLRGQLYRNLIDPPLKDTFVVPNKGYLILRFHTDNLGYWLWESRTTGTSPSTQGPPLEFVIRVGTHQNLPTVPIDFPTCGNHRGPDLIFEED